ncbi:EAL domain-containing protein [Saccharospirillum sp.]|uniref:bifunctional diguanylate cyclase/phosphodiesterase n=1 Tax=Saccharospirillum sp. TaxID=2033801 RepID=UPI0034A0A8C4
MQLTFNRGLLLSTYIQLVLNAILVFGVILIGLIPVLALFSIVDSFLRFGALVSAWLLGLGLILMMRHRDGLGHAVGILQVVLSCSSLAHAVGWLPNLPLMLLLYPSLAIFNLSTGLCLVIGFRSALGLWVWRLTALVWFPVALLLVIGHWWFPVSFMLGNNASGTTLSSAYMLLVSPCLIIIPMLGKQSFHRLSRAALYYAMTTLILTCLTWYFLNLQYHQSIRAASQNTLENLQHGIEHVVKDHQQMLSRFGRGWAAGLLDTDPDSVNRLARVSELFLEDMPSFDVVALQGRKGVISKVLAEREGNRVDWQGWLDRELGVFEGFTEGSGALITEPQSGLVRIILTVNISDGNGRLVAVGRFDDLMDHNLHLDTSPFAVQVLLNDVDIYHLPNHHVDMHLDLISEEVMTLMGGSELTLKSIHSDPVEEAFLPNFLILMVFFGMVLSVIIAMSIELAGINYSRVASMTANATRQKSMRRIQEMIVNHEPLPFTVKAVCDLLDKTLSGYHSCLWQLDEKAALFYYLASSELDNGLRKAIARSMVPAAEVIARLSSQGFSGSELLARNSQSMDGTGGDVIRGAGYAQCQAMLVQTANGQILGALELYRSQDGRGSDDRELDKHDFESIDEIIPLIAMAIERHQDRETLMYVSQHDALTGLPNRAMLENRLKQWFRNTNSESAPICLLFIDLDGFKPINDGLGHAIGDRVLMDVATRLKSQFRPDDLVVRFGGDEFVVLIQGVVEQLSTQQLIDRILTSLSEPYGIAELDISVSASIGIACVTGPSELDDPLALVQQADMAMYDAKRKGKNNAQWYSETFRKDVRSQVTLRNDLQKALKNNEFELHYQPVILNNGNINGFEALLRWNHPIHGRVPPDEFIPLAEETGQIIPLSEWVLDRACRDASKLRFNDTVRVGVNIAPLHFHRSDFISRLTGILNQHNLKPESLVLELTERTLMDEHGTMVQTLATLKKAGFRLSIDDFGTGYSSLSFIRHLPVTSVKIDKSFVADINHSELDAGMAHAIIDMAHHLGLGVVAEGVETEEQLEKLRAWGCNSLQGYHICRPGNLESTLDFIQSWNGFDGKE